MSAAKKTEYAVRWGDSIPGFSDISRAFATREEAEEALEGSGFPGAIVDRQVVTTEWVPC